MRKTYMVAKANIAKMKIQGIILVALLMISSLMLNIGLMLAINFQDFLGNMTSELNTSDAFYTLPYAQFTDDIKNRIERHEQIISLNVYDGIVANAEIADWRSGSQTTIFFRNREVQQAVSQWKLVSDTLNDVQNPVFVPYGFRTSGVFAFIIVIVCLTMIRFRINNSIEEDMPSIGSLKATGFTSWQIRSGLLGQYLAVALFGAFLGVTLSYGVLPFIRSIIAMQTGLLWQQGLDIPINIIAVVVVLLIVSILVLFSSRKIKIIDPVAAIRGGAAGNSFKRNYLPLDKTILPLNLALGSKAILQNIRQSISLFIVFTVIAFTGIFFVGMRHMATAQSDSFMALTGAEISDVVLELNSGADSGYVRDVIMAMDGVTQAIFIDSSQVIINGETTIAYVMDDFSIKVNPSVYRGRYPIHRNEIALSGVAADMLDVSIDDILHIGLQNAPFVVTGITQGQGAVAVNGVGSSISITTEGMSSIVSDFRQIRLGIYLEDGVDVSVFVAEMSAMLDRYILSAMNWRDMLEDGNATITGILVLLSTAMLGFAVVVILLVLYFIVGAVIIRRHRHLGIQKAVGFTTFEIMRQMSASFILPLIIGIVSGAVIMVFTFNNIAALVMTPLGVRQSNFDVPYLWVALTSIILAVISYAAILFITRRIGKISAYDLVR